MAGASVQSTTGSRGVPISGSNAGYTLFRDSVKDTGYSPVSPSLPLPCVTVCHHILTGLYQSQYRKECLRQAVAFYMKEVLSFNCTFSIIRGYCIQSVVLRQAHSAFQSPFTTECFLFKFQVSCSFLKFTQWLLTSSSLPSRYFYLATFPAVACFKRRVLRKMFVTNAVSLIIWACMQDVSFLHGL